MLTNVQSVVEYATKNPDACLTSVHQCLTIDLLRDTFGGLNKGAASGVDDQSWSDYGNDLEGNLQRLLERVYKNQYRANPVKRVYIPKPGDPKGRGLGIPTIEDKLLQTAVKRIVEPIFEVNFRPCSFGYRPGIGPHDCIKAIDKLFHESNGGFVIDADISKFFDAIDHQKLMEIFKRRVNDGVICRLIGKWLNAQILDGLDLINPVAGAPQGSAISPLLSNIYLNHVLDEWMQQVASRSRGVIRLFRFCDDFIIVCSEKDEAELLLHSEKGLNDRLGKYALTLHPEKTQLVDFRRGSKESFAFLGLRFFWGHSRRGSTIPKVRSDGQRMKRKMKELHMLCCSIRHWKVADQHKKLCQILVGYRGYYGISFNRKALAEVFDFVERTWYYWLNRRGGRVQMSWDTFRLMLTRYCLPKPTIIHKLF